MRNHAALTLAVLLTSLSPAVFAQSEDAEAANRQLIESTRAALEEWVDVRREISEETADWNSQQDILSNQIELLKVEIAQYEEEIARAAEETTAAEQGQAQLQDERQQIARNIDVVEEALPQLEAAIRELQPFFPVHLTETETMRQLSGQLPQERETNRPVGDRTVVVLGILGEIHKFNNTVTLQTILRQFGDQNLNLRVMYLGTAQAYFVSDDGSQAGRYMPAAGGWEWIDDPDLATDIERSVRFYRGDATVAPEYIGLPVELTDLFSE